jgi:competence protein ComEA
MGAPSNHPPGSKPKFALGGIVPCGHIFRMPRQTDPFGNIGGRVARNVTSRLITKIVGLALAALFAAVGLKSCGKPVSREQAAQRATAVVDVNSASLDDLMTLPRINETLARRIVDGRPFARVEDLEKVAGIGPKTLEAIRPRVTTGPAAPAK